MKKKNVKKIKIGIIGLGRFGTLVATILVQFFEVRVFHYREKLENKKIVKKIGAKLVSFEEVVDSDFLILAVPISETKKLIKNIAKIIKSKTVIMDTCSVKILPCEWLDKYLPKENQIIGAHPMFGPVTTKFNLDKKYFELEGKQLALCPIRIEESKLKAIKAFTKKLKLDVFEVSSEEHDKQNAKTLSLVHFLGRSLTKAGIREQRIFTPGYVDLLKILPHTNNDDWQLFYDMNNFNPFSEKIRNNFLEACGIIEDKILKADSEDEFDFKRKKINKIDRQIFELLEKRMDCVEKIGEFKRQNNLKIVDLKREDQIIKNRIKETSLNSDFIKKIYRIIFNESYHSQKNK